MELNILFPNTLFIQITKDELKRGMKYIIIKRNQNMYVFMDECKQIGNTITFLRIKAYILSKNKNKKEFNLDYHTKIINEEITIDTSYFDGAELYRF